MKKIFYCLACLALALAMTAYGCGKQSSESEKGNKAGKETPAGQAIAPVSRKSIVPIGEKPTSPALRGKVAETMNVSSYTYVRLDDDSGKEIWIAVPRTDLEAGEEVLFQGGDMVMENWDSKTLNRTFEKIIFATGVFRIDGREITGGNVAGGSDEDAMQRSAGASASGGSAANIVPFDGLKVEKATRPDSYGIGEIFEKAALLDGKHVAVRGKVVKVSKNIMGKNWIHIQDGTGDPSRNTHDLVATTMDTAETGDIVTVEGQAAAAKDFGFGYTYDVIVEDARIGGVEGGKAQTI